MKNGKNFMVNVPETKSITLNWQTQNFLASMLERVLPMHLFMHIESKAKILIHLKINIDL